MTSVEDDGVTGCGKSQSRAGFGWRRASALRISSSLSSRALAPEVPCHPKQHSVRSLTIRARARRPGIIPFCATLLIAVALASTGCKRGPGTEAAFFPASNEVEGWVTTSATRTFAAVDLWKYIDGGAEKYLKAGVQSASTADYKFQNKIEAVADIYSMANAEGAREVFDSEPAVDAKTPPLGDSARLHSQSLVFRQGPYLVRLIAYEEDPQAQQALLELGHGIDKRLPR